MMIGTAPVLVCVCAGGWSWSGHECPARTCCATCLFLVLLLRKMRVCISTSSVHRLVFSEM